MAQGFSILALMGVPGKLVVFVLGYYLLQLHLTSYVIFWVIMTLTDVLSIIFLVVFLPESLPTKLKRPITRSGIVAPRASFLSLRASLFPSGFSILEHNESRGPRENDPTVTANTLVFNPFTVYVNNFKIVWKYPVLVGAMLAVAIGACPRPPGAVKRPERSLVFFL